jgi:hypothetical protein
MENITLRFWRQGIKTITFTISLGLFLSSSHGSAQDFYAGVRGGTSFDSPQGHFYQGEGFAGWKLPWRWNVCSKWTLRPYVDASAGDLVGLGASGFVGTLGPVIELRYGKFPVFLEGGTSPTYLSRFAYDSKDLGERFQFTSHIGLQWDITKNIAVNLRFQHMSDAGITRTNPGLNVQMLCLRFNF